MYNRQARLPFVILPPAAIIALLLARPFGLISESWLFHSSVLLVVCLGIGLRWYTSGHKETFGVTTRNKIRSGNSSGSRLESRLESSLESSLESRPETNFAINSGTSDGTSSKGSSEGSPEVDSATDSRTTYATQGSYSLLRHPLELSDIILLIAALLAVGSWSFIFFGLALTGYFFAQVILTKEKQQENEYGEEYTAWCNHSNALLPQFKTWNTPPPHQFSIRQAARNTAPRLLWIILVLLLINLLRNRMIFFSWEFTPFLLYSVALLLFLYTLLRLLSGKS